MDKNTIDSLSQVAASMQPYAKAISKAFIQIEPSLIAYAVEVEKAYRNISPIVLELQKKAAESFTRILRWQEKKKVYVSTMAELGWFPNWYTFLSHFDVENNSIEEFMISHIDECWSEIQEKMVEYCPNREKILKVIFDLHDQENYIASIPLIFAQADGICAEEFTHFFSADPTTKRKASSDILEKYTDGDFKLNFFTEFLLEPFKTRLQLTNGSSKSSKKFKAKGPNRHGIIHGSRKHLDYGNKTNGYKALSFLAFLIYTTKDEFKK